MKFKVIIFAAIIFGCSKTNPKMIVIQKTHEPERVYEYILDKKHKFEKGRLSWDNKILVKDDEDYILFTKNESDTIRWFVTKEIFEKNYIGNELIINGQCSQIDKDFIIE